MAQIAVRLLGILRAYVAPVSSRLVVLGGHVLMSADAVAGLLYTVAPCLRERVCQ